MSKYSKEDIHSLIDLITWYRYEYHHSDFGHADYIDTLLNFPSDRDFEEIEHAVDDWLDY